MPRPTIREAQDSDTHTLQAMSCSGDGVSSYSSFHMASPKFFVAVDGSRIVGFICAYPATEQQKKCVRLLEPYLFTSFLGQGIEDDLKARVLRWAEEKLDCHFFKEDPYRLHPIKPHQYLESLKYDGCEITPSIEPQPVETPASQAVYVPAPDHTYG